MPDSLSVPPFPGGSSPSPPSKSPRVALFVTCLVDLHRPSVGFAAIRLLEAAGCRVEVPRAQTCCGQPAYNAGDRATARDLARRILDVFAGYDYVVAPSGSPNQNAAAAVAVQIEQVLRRAGVSPRAIEYRVYRAGPEERNAPVRIAYNDIAAHTAPCGPWPDQVAQSPDNRHYADFGCATQQNLAAMVASPLDLIYPRGMTPADAQRRATVLQAYREGKADDGLRFTSAF